MFRKSKRVRLIFKSGRVEDVRVDELKVTRRDNGATLTQMEWTNMRPRPLYLSLDELAAVLEL